MVSRKKTAKDAGGRRVAPKSSRWGNSASVGPRSRMAAKGLVGAYGMGTLGVLGAGLIWSLQRLVENFGSGSTDGSSAFLGMLGLGLTVVLTAILGWATLALNRLVDTGEVHPVRVAAFATTFVLIAGLLVLSFQSGGSLLTSPLTGGVALFMLFTTLLGLATYSTYRARS